MDHRGLGRRRGGRRPLLPDRRRTGQRSGDLSEEPLVCPACARSHPPSERFCSACGIPLVYATGDGAGEPADERRELARKIKPQYSEGRLVKVAGAMNGAEAEMIQGLLLEEGIPSMVQRSRGSDVPDFLVAGRRDLMVPESGAQAAREALAWDTPEGEEGAEGKGSAGEQRTGGKGSAAE